MTIEDVAREAGVSRATVSRALSGAPGVSAATLRRVSDVSVALGYRPNRIAQSLRKRTTKTVGMVVPDIANPFFPAVVQAVETALHESGISLLLCDAANDPAVEADRLLALLDRQVDGLVVSPVDERDSARAVAAAAAQVPLVQVDRRVAVRTDMVTVDHRLGIELAVRHLVDEVGCRSFAFVTTAARVSTASERLQAYRAAVRRVDRASARRVLAGDLSVAWGCEAARQLMETPLPDAVVCANDLIAAGLVHTFSAIGVRVPADVAVTGYDDSFFASVTDPPLTSVRQPLHQLGEEAVRLLLSGQHRSAAHGPYPRELRLIPELVVRRSSRRSAGVRDTPGTGGVRTESKRPFPVPAPAGKAR